MLRIALQIVRKPEASAPFEVLPRRWVVERTLSWITHCRRPDRDYERPPAHAETMVHWAMIGVMVRRFTISWATCLANRHHITKISNTYLDTRTLLPNHRPAVTNPRISV